MKKDGEWIVMLDYYMKNWSWCLYFFENIMKMCFENKVRFLDLYVDIEMGEMV